MQLCRGHIAYSTVTVCFVISPICNPQIYCATTDRRNGKKRVTNKYVHKGWQVAAAEQKISTLLVEAQSTISAVAD